MEEAVFRKRRQRSCEHEKIVLMIDLHSKVKSAQGWSDDDNNVTILDSIKSHLEVFILRKLKMFYRHQIAIVTFDESKVTLHSNFTTNDRNLTRILKNIDNNNENTIHITEENNFNEIINHTINILGLDSSISDSIINLRFILIYARNISPTINENIPLFLKNPWVYFDILYLHEKLSKEDDVVSNYQEIFDNLAVFQQAISDPNRSDIDNNNNNIPITEEKINYIYDSHNSSLRINSYITTLLAHSATREVQSELLQKFDKRPN
jgi:hypothetical protein